MKELPQESQAYALALTQERKAQADNMAANAMNNIVSMTLREMFLAGYRRALIDHNLIEGDADDVIS